MKPASGIHRLVGLLIILLLFSLMPAWADGIPAGRLGHPLGTYLTVEGTRVEKGKVGMNTLLVEAVNGKKLDTPVSITVENINILPVKERCILRGYESGKMIGIPYEVVRKEQMPEPQAVWQFYHYFVATSVVEPDYLRYKFIFKKYYDLVNSYAENEDAARIEELSDEFVDRHKDLSIAEIYIWNEGLNTKNNLLFKKTYRKANTASGLLVYPKINYSMPWEINVSSPLEQDGQGYILIEQQSRISYRMVILAPD